MSGPSDKPGSSAGKHADAHDLLQSSTQIASKLKALYSSVEQQPIPDVFLDLLEQLDRAEKIGADIGKL